MNRKHFSLLFVNLFLVGILAACSGGGTQTAPELSPPAISLEIKGNECPSLEAQVGMQVAWTNRDNVDRVLVLERTDNNGVLIDSGGTDLLQPGGTYSITLIEPGQYTYYCSEDRGVFGTITVLP
jgi:hypothetical protein